MEGTPAWLTHLEPHRIDDALRADAYENTPSAQRQCLKTAIAYHAASQGESASTQSTFTEHRAKGFWHSVYASPAPTLFVICDTNYTSPARLVAACMPALLAQIPHVVFISLQENAEAVAPALLVALELLGIEDAFCLQNISQCKEVFKSIPQAHQQRILLLGSTLQELRVTAQAYRIPFFEDTVEPHIFISPKTAPSVQDMVFFAHPDAHVVIDNAPYAQAGYGTEELISPMHAKSFAHAPSPSALFSEYPLCEQRWASGMEACWQIQGLSKDFFINRYFTAGTTFSHEAPHE